MKTPQDNEIKTAGLRMRPVLFALVFLAGAQALQAQYQVFYWSNFEDGKLPPGSSPIGANFEGTVNLVDFSKMQGAPPEFRAGIAASETGRCGLSLRADPVVWITGLGVGFLLDRDKLGPNGRALFQGDFFLPPVTDIMPSVAVLAMEPPPPGEKSPRSFYRFGITKQRELYFSLVVQEEPSARFYKSDAEFFAKIPRPGWHRFAIVFKGPTTIHCYVDGNEPVFSPIEEKELRQLQVGIMLAEKEKTYSAYADNLSIQWTSEDAPIPDSPYAGSWPSPAAGSAPAASASSNSPKNPIAAPASAGLPGGASRPAPSAAAQSASPHVWLDADTAWRQAMSTQKPLLVYFHAPRIPATQILNGIFDTDPSAISFLRQYTLAKIDINQLQGGEFAKKCLVFKVPSIIIYDTQGRERIRGEFSKYDTWSTFGPRLGVK